MIAALATTLIGCSSVQVTPTPPLRPQVDQTRTQLPLAEAQAFLESIDSTHRIRWREYIGGQVLGWEASYDLNLSGDEFFGPMQARNGQGPSQTLELQSPRADVATALAAIRTTALVEGAKYPGEQQLDYYPVVVLELTTERGLVFFQCPARRTHCSTWNVWVSTQPPSRDRFPEPSIGYHFLATDPQVSASLEQLHQLLGADAIRQQVERSR